ncbi:tetratricopeptide repeat protein [Patescibacteria group bacterium]|nr:tetratricopeptide repeat protein [Patescibacteria group bacterium]
MIESNDSVTDANRWQIGVFFKNYWLKLILCTALVCILFWGATRTRNYLHVSTNNKVDELSQQAENALAENKYTEALQLYRQILDYHPNYTQAYLQQAGIYVTKNKLTTAEETLLQALKQNTDQEAVYLALGEVALAANDYAAATNYLLFSDTTKPDNQLKLTEVYLRQGDIIEAQKWLSKVLENTGTGSKPHYYYAIIHLASEKSESALSEITLANEIAVENQNFTAQDIYRQLKVSIQNVETAESEIFGRALIGFTLLQEKYPRLALIPLQKVANEKPDYRDGQAMLGAAYLSIKDYESAEYALERALDLDPNYAYAHYLLGLIYEQKEQNDLAQQTYKAAVTFAPSQITYHRIYTNLLEECEKYIEAELAYRDILNSELFANTEKSEFKVRLAYLYLDHLDKLQEGLSLAQEYKNSELHAWALYKNEQSPEALAIVEQLIKEQPTAWLYYRQGKIMADLGQIREAKTSLDRAVDLDTEGKIPAIL